MIERRDPVDGTILESADGLYRGMVDGMVGPFVKLVDDGGREPLPGGKGWLAIGRQALIDHINEGRWVVV